MAISQSMSNPNDWLFQNDYPPPHIDQFQSSPPPNTFDLSTAAASRANTSSNSQGRVAKPIRRRSRASRRTPTTLLNTNTTNFRAMVQHFTGARPQAPNLGAVAGYMDHAAAAPAGFQVQYPQQQHMFVMENVHGGGVAAPGSGNRINYDSYMV